jgi:spermidine/putrescine transport system substrate-binding protein
VLSWKGYGADEPLAVAQFEEMSGHTVVNDFFNSEKEMPTKLRTNPGLYDVVMINAPFMQTALDENLVQPIDTSALTNCAGISPEQARS